MVDKTDFMLSTNVSEENKKEEKKEKSGKRIQTKEKIAKVSLRDSNYGAIKSHVPRLPNDIMRYSYIE